jgi:hypothetical protein
MIWRPLLLAALSGAAGVAQAVPMSVTEGANYAMSDQESRNAAREHCVEAAKHSALDRAGSVFEAEMKSDASEAGRDEAQIKMRSYFAGVVSSELVHDQIGFDIQGRTTEVCEVKITYDPETVSAKLQEIADAEGLRRQVMQQQSTIAALQTQVQQAALPPAVVAAQSAPPAGFAPPPQIETAYAPPHALPPAPAAIPRPIYYAPPVYYAPPPQPVYYYAPRPPAPIMVAVRPKPRRPRLVRLLTWWRN